MQMFDRRRHDISIVRPEGDKLWAEGGNLDEWYEKPTVWREGYVTAETIMNIKFAMTHKFIDEELICKFMQIMCQFALSALKW